MLSCKTARYFKDIHYFQTKRALFSPFKIYNNKRVFQEIPYERNTLYFFGVSKNL